VQVIRVKARAKVALDNKHQRILLIRIIVITIIIKQSLRISLMLIAIQAIIAKMKTSIFRN